MDGQMQPYQENNEYFMPVYGIIKTRDKKVFDTYNKLVKSGQLYHVYAYCLEMITYGGFSTRTNSSPLDLKMDKIIDILGELTDKTISLDNSLINTNQQLRYTTEQVTETTETLNDFKQSTLKMFKEEMQQIIDYVSEGKLSGDVVKELLSSGNSIAIKAVTENEELRKELSITEEDMSKYQTEAVTERIEFLGDCEFDEEEEEFLDIVDNLISNFKA